MKTLQETIKESIFDKDLATNDEAVVVKSWLDMYMPEAKGQWGNKWTVDVKNKTITGSNLGSELEVDATNQKFDGFIDGYKFIDEKGKGCKKIKLLGEIEGLKNIPEEIEEISIYQPRDFKTRSRVISDISDQLKKLKLLMFVGKDWKIGWKSIDLTDLKIPVTTLYIGVMESGGVVKFNSDIKTEILQVGYGAENGLFENLPIFKTITFQGSDFNHAKDLIEGIKDKGKSNFDKIIVNGRYLNKEEKDAIKSLLKGEDTGFAGYTEVLNKLTNINAVLNDKDGHKDRFGEPLQPGDIVVVCNSADPKYPSFFDIYKSCSENGRIRTEKQMMVPPRNVVKVNNPKILELLK